MGSGVVETPARGVIAGLSREGPYGQPRPPRRRGQPPTALLPAADPLADPPHRRPGEGDGRGDPDRGRLLGRWQQDGVVGQRQGGGQLGRLGGHGRREQHPQVDGLAGLDHPGLARLSLADLLGVDAGPLPHAGLGQPPHEASSRGAWR
jgi:hypothetical protein